MIFNAIKCNSKHLLSILLILVLILGMFNVEIYSYADQNGQYNQYDTIPVDEFGTEGELVKAELCTVNAYDFNTDTNKEYSFYLVKVPYGTKEVRFYDSDTSDYYTLNTEDLDALDRKNIGTKDDGWWTIKTSDMYDGNVVDWSGYSWLYALEQADCYCEEATYYELWNDDNPNKEKSHFFIQAGDENSPLDVLACNNDWDEWLGSGSYFLDEDNAGEIRLQLGAGKRVQIINDTTQKVWYTIDGSDPTLSESAIEYSPEEPLIITKACTVKAAAKVSDVVWGPVCCFECEVPCSAPDFTPTGGSFYAPFDLTIDSVTENANIYYTIDGSEPVDEESGGIKDTAKEYEEPVHIDEDTVVKAVAVNSEGTVSKVTTSEYHLSTGIKVDIDGDDQGVWAKEYYEHVNKTDEARLIITPYGHSKCKVIVSVAEGAVLKLGDKEITRETTGEHADKYVLELDVLENAKEVDLGYENIITVTNGTVSDKYTIYCVASLFDDVPDAVVDYLAPASQYTNGSWYGGMPTKTLICKAGYRYGVSLGNFGGYITWYYKDGIKDDPNNPYGVDFIVFGNSFDGSNEAAEPGNILVSDDKEHWYTLAGSLHYDESAIWDQKVTYTPDDDGGWHYKYAHYKFEGTINEENTSRFAFPQAFHYPLHTDQDDFTSFTTKGTMLIPTDGINQFGNVRPPYPAFGYADVGYGTGDDPENDYRFTNESSNPYGGLIRAEEYSDRLTTDREGDPCDIAWAVDENGNPVQLDEIHYIKVQTANFIDNGAIGEKSTEVNGMRIAKPASSDVGTTAAPASIKIDGSAVDLTPDKVVNVPVSGVFDIVVDAPEDANVYINSLKSHTAYMQEAPRSIVRVIVQEGEKEPLIYYFKINQTADSKTVTKVTLDPGKGLLWDKEKVDCYFDEDTFAHAEDGKIALPEATPANNKYAFLNWYDNDNETQTYAELQATDLSGTDITLCAKFAKASDVKAAKEVIEMVEALPEAADVKGTDSAAISEAREAYDALSDEAKALVSEELINKLEALEAVISGKVEAMIDALPAPSEITEDDAEAVKAAKEAYEGLSAADKAKISDAKTSKLFQAAAAVYQAEAEAAEAKVETLEGQVASLQAEAAAAAQKVAEAEAKLKELEESGEANKEAIKKAQEELEAAKKEMADAESKLKKAEEDLAAAEKKASDAETAAKQVADSYEEELALIKAQNAILKKTVKKLKAKARKKSALVSWKKVGKGFTYEVYRSTNPTRSFKKVKTTKKLKVTVKKLKKGKTYYFKARAFKKVGGKKVYTGWSNIAKAKIRKS